MTPANLIMLGLGLLAFVVGAALLLRRGGSEAASMSGASPGRCSARSALALIIFAIGLSGVGEAPHA